MLYMTNTVSTINFFILILENSTFILTNSSVCLSLSFSLSEKTKHACGKESIISSLSQKKLMLKKYLGCFHKYKYRNHEMVRFSFSIRPVIVLSNVA